MQYTVAQNYQEFRLLREWGGGGGEGGNRGSEMPMLQDGVCFCYCAYVLRISRWSEIPGFHKNGA